MADTDVFGLEEVIAHGFPGFAGSIPDLASPSSGASEEARYLAALLAASLADARTAAAAAWTPAGAGAFEASLRRLVRAATPTPADRAAREEVIARLSSLATSGISYHTGLDVQPYGSFVSGLYTPTGDLDLSLEGEAVGPYRGRRLPVASLGRPDRQAFLRALGGRLQARGAQHMLRLTHARVPIIKFVDHLTGIECDVAIDSAGAQFKSAAVGLAAGLDWRAGALVRLVKLWARAQGVNDAATGTLNSFALTMLVFFHLQTRRPAVLPPLGELVAGGEGGERPMAGGARPEPGLLAGVAAAVAAAPRAAANQETLAELLASFFGMMRGLTTAWCAGGDEAAARVLRRVRVDAWGARLRAEPWDKPDGHYLCSIEDPFDATDNCGRTVRDPRCGAAIAAAAAAAAEACAAAGGAAAAGALEALFGPEAAGWAVRGQYDGEESVAAVPPTPLYVPRSLRAVLGGASGSVAGVPPPPADHHRCRGLAAGSPAAQPGPDLDLDLAGWPAVAAAVAAAAAEVAAEEAERAAEEEARREAQREKRQKKREDKERARAEAKAQRHAEAQQVQQAQHSENGEQKDIEMRAPSEEMHVDLTSGLAAVAVAAEGDGEDGEGNATAVAEVPLPELSLPRKPRRSRKPRERGQGGGSDGAPPPPLLPPSPLPPPGLAIPYAEAPPAPAFQSRGGLGDPAAGRGGGGRWRRGRGRGRGRGGEGAGGRQNAGNTVV